MATSLAKCNLNSLFTLGRLQKVDIMHNKIQIASSLWCQLTVHPVICLFCLCFFAQSHRQWRVKWRIFCQVKSPAALSGPDTSLFIHNGLLKSTVGRWSVGNGTPVPSNFTALTFWPPFCLLLHTMDPTPTSYFGAVRQLRQNRRIVWCQVDVTQITHTSETCCSLLAPYWLQIESLFHLVILIFK